MNGEEAWHLENDQPVGTMLVCSDHSTWFKVSSTAWFNPEYNQRISSNLVVRYFRYTAQHWGLY